MDSLSKKTCSYHPGTQSLLSAPETIWKSCGGVEEGGKVERAQLLYGQVLQFTLDLEEKTALNRKITVAC